MGNRLLEHRGGAKHLVINNNTFGETVTLAQAHPTTQHTHTSSTNVCVVHPSFSHLKNKLLMVFFHILKILKENVSFLFSAASTNHH